MDLTLDSDSTAIGSLFQQIIADMKNSTPLWEDFVAKASKLHACLRAAIQAIASYLDAFQKIADAATNSRGASKDIGTALTRVCLRHKAVETRMKTFTCTIMNSLIVPMQDKLEEWKRQVVTIDKEHSKEYKRCRTELKKRSSDTLRLQKKARKGQSDLQSLVDSHMQDVSLRRAELEDVERKSLRSAMVEERLRYCNFVYMLQPVVKEECEVMSELGHLQEAMHSIAVVTKEPYILPQSSEELILESKSTFNLYPESPGGGSSSQGCSNSLGSRKSSVCSISSMNSSGSSSSPGHHYQRSCSQLIRPAIRLKLGESSDSGFCSTPALTAQSSATTSQLHAVSTWPPHNQDAVQTIDRPHTISSAYEKGHQRPSVTVYTFQNPETTIDLQKSPVSVGCRPPLPIRCSSLERPISATGTRSSNINLIQRQCPSPIPAHITKEHPQLQPTYVNMSELASMAASKITNLQLQQQQLVQQQSQKQPLLQQQEMNTSNQSRTLLQISFDTSVDNSSPNTPNLPLAEGTVASITNCSTVGITPRTSNKSSLNLLKSQKTLPQPSTNTNSIQTTLTLHGDGSIISNRLIDDKLKITETDSKLLAKSKATSSNIKVLSPEADDILRASVMQKTSMFEKLEQKQQIVNNNLLPMTARNSHIISKNEESYTCSEMTDKDSAQSFSSDQIYEDSILELNNLIGELDSFQREHELKEVSNKSNLPKILDNTQSTDDTDNISDKISVESPNYSTQSTNASETKYNNNDSEISRLVSESSSIGFENPTFFHFNNDDGSSADSLNLNSNSNIIHKHIYDNNKSLVPFDIEHVIDNSELVVIRCKDPSLMEHIETESVHSQQRLSSFRSEQLSPNNAIVAVEQKHIPEAGCPSRITRRSSINSIKPTPPIRRSSSVTPNHALSMPNSPNLISQNLMTTSVESLPPPPAFLLDKTENALPTINVAKTVKALTVIRHTPASPSALRRASTQQNLTPTIQSYRSSNIPSSGIYAQPKQVSKLSSFRTQNPGTQKTNTSLLAQLNARLMPNKQAEKQNITPTNEFSIYQQKLSQDNRHNQSINVQHMHSSEPNSPNHPSHSQPEQIYSCVNDRYYYDVQQQNQSQHEGYLHSNNDTSGIVLAKTKTEFFEKLNTKLAKQGLSGRAFAVRNLINSKALPDPRLCHESLMDQIKRGATLKHNRTINDRSAPKIH